MRGTSQFTSQPTDRSNGARLVCNAPSIFVPGQFAGPGWRVRVKFRELTIHRKSIATYIATGAATGSAGKGHSNTSPSPVDCYRPRSSPLTFSNTRSGGGSPLLAFSAACFS
jgi:hypothetical protein